MLIKLSVFDRILLLNLLPQEVDMTIYGMYQDCLRYLSFTEDEHDLYLITHQEDGEVKWTNDSEKEFYIPKNVLNIIKGRLKVCKEKDLLAEEHLSLYNKFVDQE